MRLKFIYITLALMISLSACENDLLKTTITTGTAPVLTTSDSQIELLAADSANIALSLSWTDPKYLENTSNGTLVGQYFIEMDKSNAFLEPTVIATGNMLEQSFSVYNLNKLLLDMDYSAAEANDLFVRVKSVFFNSDTLFSNVVLISVTPYLTEIPPAIAVPDELWMSGGAIPAGWITPFPANQQFFKESSTTFSIIIDLLGGKEYEMITDGNGSNWTPCYRLDPAIDPASVVWGGSFVWDGNGSPYNWGSKKFLTPPNDGKYKLTFNFQNATFTVVDVSGPPAIAIPAELWISGSGLIGGWITPFPAERQFTKIDDYRFSISIFLAASSDYEMITDGTGANWTPCYRIDPALDRTTMIWGGSFVWDGNGSAYGWGSKKFMSPPADGVYKLIFDFQTATYIVIAN
jgi:starch-binding outer membrane protein SusE/F